MIVGKVVGNIVCTQKDKSLAGQKMLIVQPVSLKTLKEEGAALVALDAVGAGQDELVLVVGVSSARMAVGYEKIAVDQAIIGILDSIDIQGEAIYRKEGDAKW